MRKRSLTPWTFLKEPRVISGFLAAAYISLITTGIIMVVAIPDVVTNVTSIPLAYFVGGCLIIGGSLGVISLHGGEWWLERAGIWLVLGGLLAYAVAIWHLPETTPEKLMHSTLTAAFMLHFMARLYKIRGLTLDPTK